MLGLNNRVEIKNRIHIFIFLFIWGGAIFFVQYHQLNPSKKEVLENSNCYWCLQENLDGINYLPVDSKITRLAFPADPDFLSSLIWIRTKYYFGSQSLNNKSFDDLLLLVDQITDLSPQWFYPYFFGGITLLLDADLPEEALFLVKKGRHFHADSWELSFLEGFIHWKSHGDFQKASRAIFSASQMEGAPEYFVPLAATLSHRSGDVEMAVHYIQKAVARIMDPTQRMSLLKKLEEFENK